MNFLPVQLATALINPLMIAIFFIRKLPLSWFFAFRMLIDGIDRPYYAYGLYQAAQEAKALGIKRISAYEFGVASGVGLVILEQLAIEISNLTHVDIDVYGFDMAIGLPESSDYRDIPYIWQKGFYKMNVAQLKRKILPTTKLVLGNVKQTVVSFAKKTIAPIGFIAFDLDYYSSTRDAFKLFDTKNSNMLPRVFCYFDDVVGTDEEILCDYVGELLAINEFNSKHANKKIAKISGLFHKRAVKSTWSDMMYVMHNFSHRLYNSYIYPNKDRQIALE
jgi:hypothetical protein